MSFLPTQPNSLFDPDVSSFPFSSSPSASQSSTHTSATTVSRPPLPPIHDQALMKLALMHRSYLATNGWNENGYIESYDKLAMVGKAALRYELMALANEEIPLGDGFAIERACNSLLSPDTLAFISKKYSLPSEIRCKPTLKPSLLPTDFANLFLAHLGAVLFDGQEPHVPLAQRRWKVPNSEKIREFVEGVFGAAIHEKYQEELSFPSEDLPSIPPTPSGLAIPNHMLISPSVSPTASIAESLSTTSIISTTAATGIDPKKVSNADAILNTYLSQTRQAPVKFVETRVGGGDHCPVFQVEAVLNGQVMGVGQGTNKKLARKIASAQICETLNVKYY